MRDNFQEFLIKLNKKVRCRMVENKHTNEKNFLIVELDETGERYIFPYIDSSKFGTKREHLVEITDSDFEKAFNFSYAMTFGKQGKHSSSSFTRDSGYKRTLGEIFVHALQGKLSEIATYNHSVAKGNQCNEVDFSIGRLDYWDNIDLAINNLNVSVKSTKGYSMFLLLEVKNYDQNGNYRYPYDGQSLIDLFLLCRVQSESGESIEGVLKSKQWLYSKELDREPLYKELNMRKWLVELTGFISKKKLVEHVIKAGHIMKKGIKMGTSDEPMKVDNYYVHVSDLVFKKPKIK